MNLSEMLKFTSMNKIFTTLLLLLLSFFTNAQVANFFADGSRWVYGTYETWEPNMSFSRSSAEQIIIHGDTVIDGITYFKLYTTFRNTVTVHVQHNQTFTSYDSVGPTFLRYDTLSNRVYHLPEVDSLERLIYDFNLQVGDTVPLQMVYGRYIPVIDSIDTITVFGVPAKRFFLDIGLEDLGRQNFIIEGMGGSNGLLHFLPEYVVVSGGIDMTHFNCFQYGDSIYSPENLECPFIDYISAIPGVYQEPLVTISPNPTHEFFMITIEPELFDSRFDLFDFSGRIVQTFTLTEETTFGKIKFPGVYFWRVEQDGRLIKTGKLISH
jgi:hypothetical protein